MRIGPEHKSLPAAAQGTAVREFLDSAPRLSDLETPVVTLDAGCRAIRLATGWQVQLAGAFAVRWIMLAHELIDPVVLRWICDELERDAEFELDCCRRPGDGQDDDHALAGRTGGSGCRSSSAPTGRADARTIAAALAMAWAVAGSPHLRLTGVACWEAGLDRHRTPGTST